MTQPVEGSKGTATYCKISGVDVAAKTGTTDENYDRWLCGFTPYYTAASWYGFDENETIEYNKKNPAGLLWANVMAKIHTGLKSATFEKPSSVDSCIICADTGKIATTGCTNTYTEYFLKYTTPGLCDKHAGPQLKENTTNTTKNKEETIQGITQDIDAVDPQQVEVHIPNSTNTNNSTTNNTNNSTSSNSTTNSTNTNKPENTTNSVTDNSSSNNTTNNTNDSNNSNKNTNSSSSNSENNTNSNTTVNENTNT